MKNQLLSLAICFVFCFGSATSTGQDTGPKGQLWFTWEATVNPSMNSQFIEFQKGFQDLFKEYDFPYNISAWTDNNFHYYFFYPVDSYNDKNGIYDALRAIVPQYGKENWAEMWETILSHRTYFVKSLPEMSYMAAKRRISDDEVKYAIWDMQYIIPGKEDEVYALGKELAALERSKNYDDNILMLEGDLGFEGSTYIGVLYGKNPADFWTENKKMWNLIGDEGREIFQKWMSYIRKREFKQFWYMEGLSYSPDNN